MTVAYEAGILRARHHGHSDPSAFTIMTVDERGVALCQIVRIEDSEYGREMAQAVCDAIGAINKRHDVRCHTAGGEEVWLAEGCV